MSTLSDPLIDAEYESLENAVSITDTAQDDSSKTVEVVAPATLMEGYELTVNVDGKSVTVIVPPGGVNEGETFAGALRCGDGDCRHHAPVGHWRDGLYDCCKLGCCHPLLCTAWCCVPVVLAQVLYRLRLNWCGRPSTRKSAETAFAIVVGCTFIFFVVRNVLQFAFWSSVMKGPNRTYEEQQKVLFLMNIQNILNISFFVFLCYLLLLMSRARRFIRNKYAIRTQQCGMFEDCCCAWWCTCCAVSQMARHTADYEVYGASCCSKTGLPSHAPEIV